MQWLTIRDAQAYSYCETLRSGSKHFHAELWPNNATRLSRIDWSFVGEESVCVGRRRRAAAGFEAQTEEYIAG